MATFTFSADTSGNLETSLGSIVSRFMSGTWITCGVDGALLASFCLHPLPAIIAQAAITVYRVSPPPTSTDFLCKAGRQTICRPVVFWDSCLLSCHICPDVRRHAAIATASSSTSSLPDGLSPSIGTKISLGTLHR